MPVEVEIATGTGTEWRGSWLGYALDYGSGPAVSRFDGIYGDIASGTGSRNSMQPCTFICQLLKPLFTGT